ncbi:AMP-binding protein [Amycolatopsis sp. NPDC059021]|uniref:AMP-binding protein n=1 Tax=Amycolatopsis sp. NPDC059021 TaxID=3346704 RepID=UPI00366E9F48
MTVTVPGLHGRFLRGLARSPHGPAVVLDTGTLTYTELHERALSLAGMLAGRENRVVGVLAEKGPAAYTGILATLYAGATVVPLRPGFPAVRTQHMLDAAKAGALIVDAAGAKRLSDVDIGDALVITGDTPGTRALTEPRTVRPDDVAYLLFTSGSTGRPKGVAISHGNVEHYFGFLDARFGFTAADVFSQTFDLNFDCSLFDLFCAWGAGAAVAVPARQAYRDLSAFLAGNRVTVWFSTPSAIALARRTGALADGAFPGLRWSFFAGEALQCRDVQDWCRAAPGSVVENLYGPTEATVTVTAHRWHSEESPLLAVNGVVPIGLPNDGHDHLLLGGDDEGELCVAGPQLTPGYLDPADGEGRFFERDGKRWYRTGDRVRRLGNGELGYVGRLDSQVQVRGWRVEPAEIEHALRDTGIVRDAVVVGVPGADGTELAVFYLGEPVAPIAFASALREVLPDGLIPRRYHHVDEFPVNANRKLDRSALAARARE